MSGNGLLLGLIRAVDCAVLLEGVEQPTTCVTSVSQGLESAESLRNDDEESGLWVEVLHLLSLILWIDVGDEASSQASVCVWLQCFVNHDWAQIRATDADVDDGGNLLAGHASMLAGANLVGESINAVENFVNVSNNVLAVDDELAFVGSWAAQCGVQNSAVLSVVNVLTREHSLGALLQLHSLGEVSEESESFWLDQVLGQIKVQIASFEGELSGTLWVLLEPLAQVDAFGLQIVIVLLQCLPSVGLRSIDWWIDGHYCPFRAKAQQERAQNSLIASVTLSI